MFALGDSSYPSFCGFGKLLDAQLHNLGASRMLDIGLGDELGEELGLVLGEELGP